MASRTTRGSSTRLAVPIIILLVAAACSTGGGDERGEGAAVAAASEAARLAESEPEAAPTEQQAMGPIEAGASAMNRLVVATDEGEIYLLDPDGSDRLDLVAADDNAAVQPVWSPDGRRVGWSQSTGSGFSIASANIDGTERRQATTPFGGYFGSWDPTSTLLGFLGNAAPGTGLVLDDGTGADIEQIIDSDTFYYFSWSPDGSRWVVHSGSGLRIVSRDGSQQTIDLDDGEFRAPIWEPRGTILLAVAGEDVNVIVRFDPESGSVEPLLEVGIVANIVLDPTGRFLAIETAELAGAEDATVAAQPASLEAEVLVLDLETGETWQAFDRLSGGFWWSPDGSMLAILAPEDDSSGFVRWEVWRPDTSFVTERFVITPTFAQTYVPFFDQFAQSVTPWSPDSSQFVYTGFDEAGTLGVFVQAAAADIPAQRVADDGAIAFWSPT